MDKNIHSAEEVGILQQGLSILRNAGWELKHGLCRLNQADLEVFIVHTAKPLMDMTIFPLQEENHALGHYFSYSNIKDRHIIFSAYSDMGEFSEIILTKTGEARGRGYHVFKDRTHPNLHGERKMHGVHFRFDEKKEMYLPI